MGRVFFFRILGMLVFGSIGSFPNGFQDERQLTFIRRAYRIVDNFPLNGANFGHLSSGVNKFLPTCVFGRRGNQGCR